MASTHPRSGSPAELAPPPEKKLRLDAHEDVPQAQVEKKNKKKAWCVPEPYSHDDILTREVVALLGQDAVDAATAASLNWDAPFERFQHLELTVASILPSTGKSLSIAAVDDRRWVIVTPLSLPGERSSLSPATKPTHLVDAYCGSGLFSIMLAPHFDRVAGIELSAESICAAQRNAELNALSLEKISFMAGDAANIFETVQDFPRKGTVLIIDPPRKGTDERFIEQMVAFGVSTVVYVSCNVHTQARDVGIVLKKSVESAAAQGGRKYVSCRWHM
ncbi:S-adenosyl-L-methionine-dependent methyltransferase [Trametes maxima]|nr:S-adenosyl-L-methionine-dependent methyltransferase [Trametes maxima]